MSVPEALRKAALQLIDAPESERMALIRTLSPEERGLISEALDEIIAAPRRRWYCLRLDCDGNPHTGMHFCEHPVDAPRDVHEPRCRHARTAQRPPTGDEDWLLWLFEGGRGTGKTKSGAEWTLDRVWNQGARRIALVGRTPADVRDTMIWGPAGIMASSPPHERPEHQPSKRRLVWPNGAQAFTYSAIVPSQLRGPEHDTAWCDEPAAWRDAKKGDAMDTSLNNLLLGLRSFDGPSPKVAMTTTPRRVKLILELHERHNARRTHGTTYDNLENLAPVFRDAVLTAYEGTRIGAQELEGRLLTDVQGALWTFDDIAKGRGLLLPEDADPADHEGQIFVFPSELSRLHVAVDPTVTSGENPDEAGIVVAARGPHQPLTCELKKCPGHAYVLEDATIDRLKRPRPRVWGKRAIDAYDRWDAQGIVAEGNQGEELITELIHLGLARPDVAVTRVNARQGKDVRAGPVAALYEQGRVHHLGPAESFGQLEDQMTSWVPDDDDQDGVGMTDSPDRMDALVYAILALDLVKIPGQAVRAVVFRKAERGLFAGTGLGRDRGTPHLDG